MRKHALLILLVLLAGCALQAVLPSNHDQRLDATYGQHTAALRSIGANVNNKRMSGADGQHAIAIADNARYFLDASRNAGDVQTAEAQLNLAAGVLRQLQTYIDERAKP